MINLSRSEIEALIDPALAARAIEDAYRAVSRGKVDLPPVGHIMFPAVQADCHIKYGHIRGDAIFVIKVATGFPLNAAQGLPNGNGVSLVLSAQTGAMRAVLHDEMVMTDIRTGLGGAIASRLLARPQARRILIVGTGEQARRQIEAHHALLGPEMVFRIWGRAPEKAAQVADACAGFTNVEVVEDLATACRTADIVVMATGATMPIIRHDWIGPGTHITAVGADAPGKRELETDLVAAADGLFADLRAQCLDHGELAAAYTDGIIEAQSVAELGDVLNGAAPGRKTQADITIADLTGIAAQDIAMARIVLEAHDAARGGAGPMSEG